MDCAAWFALLCWSCGIVLPFTSLPSTKKSNTKRMKREVRIDGWQRSNGQQLMNATAEIFVCISNKIASNRHIEFFSLAVLYRGLAVRYEYWLDDELC